MVGLTRIVCIDCVCNYCWQNTIVCILVSNLGKDVHTDLFLGVNLLIGKTAAGKYCLYSDEMSQIRHSPIVFPF